MSAPAANRWYEKWPEIGSDVDFAALRQLLTEAGYTEAGILARLGREHISEYCAPPPGGRELNDALDALIALFDDCSYVEESQLTSVLTPSAVALFDRLGLLARDPAPGGSVFATSAILLTHGLWILCDRGAGPDGSRAPYPPDVVYPPVFDTTERFLAEIPDAPCEALLDLGTGTGAAAMLGARTATHAWATDITPRSIRFTEFNLRLNGADNVTAAVGDLYEAVQGLTFDRIVIHPPYIPAKIRRSDHVFAVSGDDGEQILRRTVEGLPDYLRPGGRFYSLQQATDRVGEDFEVRVRKWLGEHHEEFDVLLAIHSRRLPTEYLADDPSRLLEERQGWVELWEQTKTTHMVYATLLIERHAESHRPLTRRAHKGAGYSCRHLEWLLEWQKALTREDHVELLLGCRPLGRPENVLVVTHQLGEGGFRPKEFRLEIPGPFFLSLRCEDWLPRLIPACNGVTTWGEHFENARQQGWIREEVPIEEFARALGVLVALGAVGLGE